jgi:hypothetical protein
LTSPGAGSKPDADNAEEVGSMEVMPIIESLFRWIHVVAGVLWIGLLYFFNWVNANVMPKLDGETRKNSCPS